MSPGAVEALACAHTFHSVCLDSYCATTNRNRANCCPFKCNADALMFLEEQQVVPNPDDIVVDAVDAVDPVDEDLLALADAERERARANMF